VAKKARERERDLLVEVREVEALSLECRKCGARCEVTWESQLKKGAPCPACGESLEPWRRVATLYRDFMRATMGDRDVRLRVRLLTRLPL
jgi:hypothetical protein